MSNYYGNTRTNYFKVKDAEKLKTLMLETSTSEGNEIFLWEKNGSFAFGCYDTILGIREVTDENDDGYAVCEFSETAFYERLQDIIAEGEVVVIIESGHEKLRDVHGQVTVISSKDIRYKNLHTIATEMAKDMLGNPKFCMDI